MVQMVRSRKAILPFLLLAFLLPLSGNLQAKNEIMGRVKFTGSTRVERESGVWIDGRYVGFVKELKGSKKVLLLPGKHHISVRQSGYRPFNEQIEVRPGETQVIHVSMQKDPSYRLPQQTAQVKIAAQPERAAVFVDGRLVGHVSQFNGFGHGLLLAPGKHQIKISLPGYRPFETEINLSAHQKLTIKTDLVTKAG